MEREKLVEILDKHSKWLRSENGGEKANLYSADLHSANLSYANLSYANLSYANLYSADLSYANLYSADLHSANLSYANLSYANLYSADLHSANLKETIYEDINWLAFIGIVPMSGNKARAYKLINSAGEGIFKGGINYLKKSTFQVEEVDADQNQQCSYGINLATFSWCIFNHQSDTDRLLLMEFNVIDAICPFGSDGKFRVKKCCKIGECDWKGNLIINPTTQ
jgi:hypothetical protein